MLVNSNFSSSGVSITNAEPVERRASSRVPMTTTVSACATTIGFASSDAVSAWAAPGKTSADKATPESTLNPRADFVVPEPLLKPSSNVNSPPAQLRVTCIGDAITVR